MKFLIALLFSSSLCFASDFQEMMGKGTPHWSEVKTPEDLQNLAFYQNLYEKRSNVTARYTIPKTLHFIWVGSTKIPKSMWKNMKGWMALHPGWKVKFWSDRNIKGLPKTCQLCRVENFPFKYVKHCFEDTKNDAEKEELLRNEILFHEGGVFVDADVACVKNLDEINASYDFYCSLAPPHDPVLSSSISLSGAVVAATSHHPILKRTLQEIAANWSKVASYYPGADLESALYRVVYRTCLPFNEAVQKENGPNDVVFPALYFHSISDRHALYAEHTYDCSFIKGMESFESIASKDLDLITSRVRSLSILNAVVLSIALFIAFFFGIKSFSRWSNQH